MGTLPTYQNNSVHVEGETQEMINGNHLGRALGRAAEEAKDVYNKWREMKDTTETLLAKNKLASEINGILDEANAFTEYDNPKAMAKKESDLKARLDTALNSVAKGFTSNYTANLFAQNSFLNVEDSKAKLGGIFRAKYIDLAKGELMNSEEINRSSFNLTGDENYRLTHLASLKTLKDTGFIDNTEFTKAKNNLKYWDVSRAYAISESDPDTALDYLKAAFKNPAADEKSRACMNYIEKLKNRTGELMGKGRSRGEAISQSVVEAKHKFEMDSVLANVKELAKDDMETSDNFNALSSSFDAVKNIDDLIKLGEFNENDAKSLNKEFTKIILKLGSRGANVHFIGNEPALNSGLKALNEHFEEKGAVSNIERANLYYNLFHEIKRQNIDPLAEDSASLARVSGIVKALLLPVAKDKLEDRIGRYLTGGAEYRFKREEAKETLKEQLNGKDLYVDKTTGKHYIKTPQNKYLPLD